MANNTLVASDSFSSGLSAGWTAVSGFSSCQIVGSFAEGNVVGTTAGQIWTQDTFPNDQISEITVQTLSNSGSIILLFARIQPSSYSGYTATLAGSALKIFRLDSGVGTQIGTTVSGLTIGSGDAWSLTASGSYLTVYQNGLPVYWTRDATYASGSVGFGINAASSLSTAQVASWRGYNIVQQDGIWTKQQVVFRSLAGDITTGGGYGVTNLSQILYEGNAQLLSGTVYKTWISVDQSPGSIWYAESLDGITWTRSNSAVVANYITPNVIKQGTTYIMYAQNSASAGAGQHAFDQLTSTDGIHWTVAHIGVLGKSVSGWDSTSIWSMVIADIVSGVWYALYSCVTALPAGTVMTGLATSSDGITWTKYLGNPVLSHSYVQMCQLINGKYYIWTAEGLGYNRGQAIYGSDPIESVRYSSPDLINWTQETHAFHNSETFESVGWVSGQCYPNWIMDVGGTTYAYLTSGANDNGSGPHGAPLQYQIVLATAPATRSQIVQFSEEAVSAVGTDSFSGGSGDLNSNWTTPSGVSKLHIAAYCQPSLTNTVCTQRYSGTFSNDQYSEITVQKIAAGGWVYPTVREQSAGANFYEAVIGNTAIGALNHSIGIYKSVSGVETLIGSSVSTVVNVGDVFRLQVIGTILSLFQNGFLLLQVQDYSNAFTSGAPGIKQFGTVVTNSQISLWTGGNANVLPNYATSPVLPVSSATMTFSPELDQTQCTQIVRGTINISAGTYPAGGYTLDWPNMPVDADFSETIPMGYSYLWDIMTGNLHIFVISAASASGPLVEFGGSIPGAIISNPIRFRACFVRL